MFDQYIELSDCIEEAIAMTGVPDSRELALVKTKLEEARLWLTQVIITDESE